MPHNSSSALANLGDLKARILGGAIFLIPGVLALWVLAKVFGLLRELALAVGSTLGIELPWGGVLLDVVVVAAVVFLCFLAGSIAERAAARRLRSKLDSVLLGAVPGYAFVKGLAENIQQSEAAASSFTPVLVTMDDCSQVAFETDRIEGGAVAVYLPGAPNPWSGNVIFVSPDRVKKLDVSATEALKILHALGRGSETLALAHRALEAISAAGESH
jgi:uncharacterized membrane protein